MKGTVSQSHTLTEKKKLIYLIRVLGKLSPAIYQYFFFMNRNLSVFEIKLFVQKNKLNSTSNKGGHKLIWTNQIDLFELDFFYFYFS